MRKLVLLPLTALAFPACSENSSALLAPEDAVFARGGGTYLTDGKLFARGNSGVSGNIELQASGGSMTENFSGAGFRTHAEVTSGNL